LAAAAAAAAVGEAAAAGEAPTTLAPFNADVCVEVTNDDDDARV